MDPPELASEPAPCYARRGRIEPPYLGYHFMSRFLWTISYFALVYKVAVEYLFIQVELQKDRLFMRRELMNLPMVLSGSNHLAMSSAKHHPTPWRQTAKLHSTRQTTTWTV